MIPMRLGSFGKIGIGWTALTVAGVLGFIASKSTIDKKRYENMKIRDRMRKSNYGEYEIETKRKFGK